MDPTQQTAQSLPHMYEGKLIAFDGGSAQSSQAKDGLGLETLLKQLGSSQTAK